MIMIKRQNKIIKQKKKGNKHVQNEGNYFYNSRGQKGGSAKQLNTTSDVAKLLDNKKNGYWEMKNGYLMPKGKASLKALGERLRTEQLLTGSASGASEGTGSGADEGKAGGTLYEEVVARMRVGVHWDTAVRRGRRPDESPHRVCQVFSSAVPCSYAKNTSSGDWAPLAKAILDATYEATLAVAALLARQRGARVKVFLTSVGGGAFGNRSLWIVAAVERALKLFSSHALDVFLVHYMKLPKGDFREMEARLYGTGKKPRKKTKGAAARGVAKK